MHLNHIGINIVDTGEIQHFYQDILGFYPERSFPINLEISKIFFDIKGETKAFIVKNKSLRLELFLYDKPINTGYAHLCVEVEDREETVRKSAANGYPVIRMKRESGDLLFVKDKAGNVFELKNKRHENLS